MFKRKSNVLKAVVGAVAAAALFVMPMPAMASGHPYAPQETANTFYFPTSQQMLKDAKHMLKQAEDIKDDNDYSHGQAVAAYQSAQDTLVKAQQDVQDAQKNLAAAKAIKVDSKSVANARDFFTWLGADEAAQLLSDQSSLQPYVRNVKLNDPKDAASFQNMKKALNFIDEMNRKRTTDNNNRGLQPMNVSATLMAVGIVNADTARTLVGQHTGDFSGSGLAGENLSWGYSDPLAVWYDGEKKTYDGGNTNYNQTGHYQNIVNSYFAYVGAGHAIGGRFRTADSEEFDSDPLGSSMTTDQMRSAINRYLASHGTVDDQKKQKAAAIKAAQKKLDEAKRAESLAEGKVWSTKRSVDMTPDGQTAINRAQARVNEIERNIAAHAMVTVRINPVFGHVVTRRVLKGTYLDNFPDVVYKGYMFTGWHVGGKIFTINLSDNEYKLNKDTTVTMGFVKDYRDVHDKDWFFEAVSMVTAYKVMTGYSNGSNRFGPHDLINREQAATILYRMAGQPSVSGSLNFQDANRISGWARKAVLWTTQHHVMNGYGNGMFGPKDTLTREQAAAILFRNSKAKSISEDDHSTFDDMSGKQGMNPSLADACTWAVGNGIITGWPGRGLYPTGLVDRAQMAKMLQQIVDGQIL